jgi:hypothetical protein
VSQAAVVATGATTARSIANRASDSLSALDYGMLDDSSGEFVAENTSALKTALQSANKFTIPSSLSVQINSFNQALSGSRIRIDGTVKMSANSNSSLLSLDGDTILEGIGVLDGNEANNPSSPSNVALIYNSSTQSRIIVRDLVCQNAFGWSWSIGANTGGLSSQIFFDNVTSINSGDAPEFFNATNCGFWRGTLINNAAGLTFYGQVSDSWACDSYFIGNLGFSALGCVNDSGEPNPSNNIIMSRNIVLNSVLGIAHISNNNTNAHTNILTVGNIINAASSFAINIGSVIDGEVFANYIYGPTTGGILVQQASKNIRIGQNNIHNINGTAITCAGSNGVVDGNFIYDDQSTPTVKTGVSLAGAALTAPPMIGLNHFSDNIAAPFGYQASYFESIFGFFSTTAVAVPTFFKNIANKITGFANKGLAIGWNQSSGQGEVNYICGNGNAPGGHYFAYADINGNLLPASVKLLPTGIVTTGTMETGGYTVAQLPAGTLGMRAYVTDATSPTFLGTLTGGGIVKCPVFYNGSAWVAG